MLMYASAKGMIKLERTVNGNGIDSFILTHARQKQGKVQRATGVDNYIMLPTVSCPADCATSN